MKEVQREQSLQSVIESAKHVIEQLSALLKIVDNGDGKEDTYIAAGKISEYANHYSSAISCYQRALAINPKAHEALARLAIVQMKSGCLQDAISTASQLTLEEAGYRFETLDGRPTSAFTVLGDGLRLAGKMEAAAGAYKQALNVQGADGYAAGKLAELLLRAGDVKEATALSERIDKTDNFSGLMATLRLVGNNPKALPAVLELKHENFVMKSPV
jgi:tetratricopeptide (TPR) repeat protein